MCFVRCLVCFNEVEKKRMRKRNSSRQEIRKVITTCLHLYIPKSFPSYDHVRWRKHLNYQGQQHGEISPFSSVNHQTLPGKRSGGGGGNRVVREKIANGMDWFARARNGASPSRASKQQHITTRGGKRDEPRMLLANIEEGSDKASRESRISQLPSRRLCSRMERGGKK